MRRVLREVCGSRLRRRPAPSPSSPGAAARDDDDDDDDGATFARDDVFPRFRWRAGVTPLGEVVAHYAPALHAWAERSVAFRRAARALGRLRRVLEAVERTWHIRIPSRNPLTRNCHLDRPRGRQHLGSR